MNTIQVLGRRVGAVLAAVVVATACGGGGATVAPSNQKEVTLRLTTSVPPDHPISIDLKKFAQAVSDKTKKTAEHVTVKVYDSGSLFAIGDEFGALQKNEVQLSEVVPSFATGQAPSISVSDLPFLFPDTQTLYKALDGQFGKLWHAQFDKVGVVPLADLANGYVDLFLTKKAVTVPADIKGQRLRLPGTYYAYWGTQVGAAPVNLSGALALQAMQNGTLDGHITTDVLYVSRKQYEAAPYVTINFNISVYTYELAANKTAWGQLSSDTQTAIKAAAADLQKQLRTDMIKADNQARADMKSQYAKQVVDLTPAQRLVWEATAKSTWDKWVKDNGADAQPLLDAALAARK
jgi:C4-dicarboxylate-binding protein DctP